MLKVFTFLIGSDLRSNLSILKVAQFLLFLFPNGTQAEKLPQKQSLPKVMSLFLPPEETDTPQKPEKNPPSPAPVILSDGLEAIYLGALFFQSQHNWTLWVNERRIMSNEDVHHKLPQGLKIEEVTESQVVFSLTLSQKSAPLLIVLHPNQTYLIEAQEVWEGDQRPEE